MSAGFCIVEQNHGEGSETGREQLGTIAAFEFTDELFQFEVGRRAAGAIGKNAVRCAKLAVLLPGIVVLKQNGRCAHHYRIDGTNFNRLVAAAAVSEDSIDAHLMISLIKK